MAEIGTMRVKSGLAEMLKGGVIMDVTDADQARIAEEAGACAVMALERVPADIRAEGGVARMADPDKVIEIQEAVSIPVMAKARIGHFVEAQILQALQVDYIDESEVLTPADTAHHIDKWKFTVPFVCGCTNIGEALRRIGEGAAMIRTKGEAGTGDIVNAVTHMRSVFGAIKRLGAMDPDELYSEAKNVQAPVELVRWVAENGRLPVVTFTAGGIATPADAALCMQLGADGVFVGSGIFKSGEPERAGEGDRRGDDALRGRGDPRARLPRARRRDERPLGRRAQARRAARDARLVSGGQPAAEAASRPASWLENPSRLERRAHRGGGGVAVEGLRRGDGAVREVDHRRAREVERALRMIVSALRAQAPADVPERRDQMRPSWCTSPSGRSGSAGSSRAAAGSAERSTCTTSSPSPRRTAAARARARRASARRRRRGHGPVVAEALADRAGLLAAEREALREVDRVAVLVQDHLGVLGVVDAALAEAQLVLRMIGRERVVLAPLVDADVLRLGCRSPAGTSCRSRGSGCTSAPR